MSRGYKPHHQSWFPHLNFAMWQTRTPKRYSRLKSQIKNSESISPSHWCNRGISKQIGPFTVNKCTKISNDWCLGWLELHVSTYICISNLKSQDGRIKNRSVWTFFAKPRQDSIHISNPAIMSWNQQKIAWTCGWIEHISMYVCSPMFHFESKIKHRQREAWTCALFTFTAIFIRTNKNTFVITSH